MSSRAAIIRKQHTANGAVPKALKIVVTGPFSAGKTTLIKTISEVAIVGTERAVSDESSAQKANTTVAMDFGRISFGDGLSLYLFGTPGQRRFEVMWEILSEGMLGYVVLVRAGDEASLEEARHILDTFKGYADVPHVIGVSHLDDAEDPDAVLRSVRESLELPPEVEVVPCDPRDREHVKWVLLQVLFGVLRRLEDADATA